MHIYIHVVYYNAFPRLERIIRVDSDNLKILTKHFHEKQTMIMFKDTKNNIFWISFLELDENFCHCVSYLYT